MASPIRTLVQEYGWIHTGLGLFGNVNFFLGSILFLPTFEPIKIWGVWMFVVGAGFMLAGAVGSLLTKIYEVRESRGSDMRDTRRGHGHGQAPARR